MKHKIIAVLLIILNSCGREVNVTCTVHSHNVIYNKGSYSTDYNTVLICDDNRIRVVGSLNYYVLPEGNKTSYKYYEQ